MARHAIVERTTRETRISLELELDGTGQADIRVNVGFFEHMLTLLAGHSRFDLKIHATGDTHIDDHHTVEDVGLALGSALSQALGEKKGIVRYGHMTLPMDETLVTTAVDLGGRPFFSWNVALPAPKVGSFDTELGEEFFRAFAMQARMNFHAVLHYGRNAHHILEAVFKSAARSLAQAVSLDPRWGDAIPSTKGIL